MTRSSVVVLLTLFCCISVEVSGDLINPGNREKYQEQSYVTPFNGVNVCAYKQVTDSDGQKLVVWGCGLTERNSAEPVTYDCCPGFQRSKIANNECVEVEPTYKSIIQTLNDESRPQTAQKLLQQEPELGNDESPQDYTVFVPEDDNAMRDSSPDAMTAPGRVYSNKFRNGKSAPAANGQSLKFSTSRNGLAFVECRTLLKPDQENANGLIHKINKPIQSTKNYQTVISRLQADRSLSNFVADLPSDLREALDNRGSEQRYTVFAPTNQAWSAAKREVSGTEAIADLARQHVMDGLKCGGSIDLTPRIMGPTKADSYIRAQQQPDGKRSVTDACGRSALLDEEDMMAGNGVVHKLSGVLQGTKSLNFAAVLECISHDPKSELNRAAKQMSQCNINVHDSEDAVVLLPTNEAFSHIRNTDQDLNSQLSSNPCPVYSHAVLTSTECKMKNPNGIGVPQECMFSTKYTAPNGEKPKLSNQYMRTRDGSKIHFGKAKTTGVKPIEFNGGVIYPVESLNVPPTKNMMQIIAEDPEMVTTYKKMQSTGYEGVLRRNSPNVAFFAPANHGWITRKKENAYGAGSLRSLLDMHTMPHQVITGPNGNIDSETIRKIDSLSPTKLTIKRNLDGNTYIGYKDMPEDHWSMVVGEPRVATDGVVVPVDWPLICKNC